MKNGKLKKRGFGEGQSLGRCAEKTNREGFPPPGSVSNDPRLSYSCQTTSVVVSGSPEAKRTRLLMVVEAMLSSASRVRNA